MGFAAEGRAYMPRYDADDASRSHMLHTPLKIRRSSFYHAVIIITVFASRRRCRFRHVMAPCRLPLH